MLDTSPVRILFVSHYALPHIGGIEVGIDEIARRLAGRGHEPVHVASAAPSPGQAEQAPAPDAGQAPYRVVRVPAWNVLERRAGVPVPLFSPRLLSVLRAEVARADVVHGHGFLYASTLAALRLAARRRPSAPRVLTEHVGHVSYDSAVLDAVERAAIATHGRLAARAAQALVVYNDKVERELRGIAPGRPVWHIGNGVNFERYRAPAPGERAAVRERLGWDGRPRALFVGRLVAKKGFGVALEAAGRAGVSLAVVGPGELPDPPAGVEVLGPQPPEVVADLYRAADVFVLPSRGEGFPFTAQEALASGLPIVLGDDPAYARHLRGAGPAAQLVPADPDSVAAAIRAVVEDPAARERAASAAAEHARRNFSWEHAADEHERLYDSLAGS